MYTALLDTMHSFRRSLLPYLTHVMINTGVPRIDTRQFEPSVPSVRLFSDSDSTASSLDYSPSVSPRGAPNNLGISFFLSFAASLLLCPLDLKPARYSSVLGLHSASLRPLCGSGFFPTIASSRMPQLEMSLLRLLLFTEPRVRQGFRSSRARTRSAETRELHGRRAE